MANAPLHLFGILALRHGALRPEQLQYLIQEQAQEPGTPLGELARRRGILTARQVRRLLELQRTGTVDADATTFGGLLLQNGFASLDEVGEALQAQRSAPPVEGAPPPLGEILVGMGTLDEQQRYAILIAQRRLRGIEPSGELDFETRILPALVGAQKPSPEPQGWLIQETGDDMGKLFPLGHKSEMGRLPEHDVPVPDMAASRDHAVIEYSPAHRRHVVRDLDSRNGTFVNGAPVTKPHPLQPGDHIQVGSTIYRYVAGGGIGGGHTTIVTRLSLDAARAARDVATKAVPMFRVAASAAGDTARKLLDSRRYRMEALIVRRDSLLDRVGRAAFQLLPDLPGSRSVDRAKRKLEELKRSGEPAVIKWAERRVVEAVRQLGRTIVDRGPAPEGEMPVIVEIREIDAEIVGTGPLPAMPATE